MPADPSVQEALDAIGSRDHTITREYRIFGLPGTSKTTSLAGQVRRAVDRFGPESVRVTSFSRAAAAEIADRDLGIGTDQVGTLHSQCWHALGGPAVAEAHVNEWNRRYPNWKITPVKSSIRLKDGETEDEPSGDSYPGDRWLHELNRTRGLLVPQEFWPAALRRFADQWTEYKRALGLLDFCDLIEFAYRDVDVASGRPAAIFVDEAQDLNPMQLGLVRKWGSGTEYFVIAADDDQTIYSWCGAVPEAVLEPEIPNDHTIFLTQSERVPRSIHEIADRLIRQVSCRQQESYEPRPADGVCMQLSRGGYRSPENWILKTAIRHVESGQTVMFLASCSYMLQPVVATLRKWGIPFHNPYRKSNGFWNPLRLGRRDSAGNRILASLVAHPGFGEGHRPWTNRDLGDWTAWLKSKSTLKSGARELIERSRNSTTVVPEGLADVFEASALESLLSAFKGDRVLLLDWWLRRIAIGFQSRVKFPTEIIRRNGPRGLRESPKVIVGTIHSVKGGEADVVFLFPDLSAAGDAAYQRRGPQRDAVIRLFYVGMTRARETLYLCERESARAISIVCK